MSFLTSLSLVVMLIGPVPTVAAHSDVVWAVATSDVVFVSGDGRPVLHSPPFDPAAVFVPNPNTNDFHWNIRR